MPGGRKVSYVLGGMGKKPDTNLRNVSVKRLSRKGRMIRYPAGMTLRQYLAKTYDYPLAAIPQIQADQIPERLKEAN